MTGPKEFNEIAGEVAPLPTRRRCIENAELDNWFGYHPPSSPAIADGHDFVRRESRELAVMLNALLPEGAEKTLALRKIREAAMWANAAIACKQEIGERPWLARPVSVTVQPAETVYVNVYADPAAAAEMAQWLGEALADVFGEITDEQKQRFATAVDAAISKAAQVKQEEPDAEAV